MCHHYDREQLTTTEPTGAEHVDEDTDAESRPEEPERDGSGSADEPRSVDAPPAADD